MARPSAVKCPRSARRTTSSSGSGSDYWDSDDYADVYSKSYDDEIDEERRAWERAEQRDLRAVAAAEAEEPADRRQPAAAKPRGVSFGDELKPRGVSFGDEPTGPPPPQVDLGEPKPGPDEQAQARGVSFGDGEITAL